MYKEKYEKERTRAERKNKESERRGTGKAREIKKGDREKSREKSLVIMAHCSSFCLVPVAGNKCNDVVSRPL